MVCNIYFCKGGDYMLNETCKDCEYFMRHYIKRAKRYVPLIYGHCMEPRLKNRDINHPACEKFSPRNPNKNTT